MWIIRVKPKAATWLAFGLLGLFAGAYVLCAMTLAKGGLDG